jgi:hypothetical protein
MGKKQTKSEKLDLILSELADLKADIRKLLKSRTGGRGKKALSNSTPAKRQKRSQNPAKPGEGAPAMPVLIPRPSDAARKLAGNS